jgi:hypothetical protein
MKNKKILIGVIICGLLGVGGTAFALVKHSQSTSSGPVKKEGSTMVTDRGQRIDMSPATPEDNKDINDKKVPGGMDDKPVTSNTLQVTITRANQDAAKSLQVRSLLSGLTAGTCRLTLTKEGRTIQKTATVSLQNTGYICDGFDVAASEFAGQSGAWRATLLVTSIDNKTGTAEQDVTIDL